MPLQFNPFTGTFDVTTKGDTGTVAAAGDGSATAPGITFASDTDSGVYRTGPNALAVSTGGTGRLFIDSSGRVGIGTSPITALHVYGASAQIRVESSTGTDGNIRFINTSGSMQIGLTGAGGNTFLLYDNINGALAYQYAGAASAGTHTWFTNNTERLRITSTGQLSHIGAGSSGSPAVSFSGSANSNSLVVDSSSRVGIGTSTPVDTLHVSGGITVQGTDSAFSTTSVHPRIYRSGTASGTYPFNAFDNLILQTRSDGTLADIVFATGGGGSQRMVFTGGGRLGIGNTSPQGLLDLGAAVDATKLLLYSSGNVKYGFGIATDTLRYFVPGTSAVHSFGGISSTDGTTYSERMRLTGSGQLLVGTNADSGGSKLQINDNRIRIATAKTPVSATDTGVTGEICWDANYIYVCTATNTWKRTAIATW